MLLKGLRVSIRSMFLVTEHLVVVLGVLLVALAMILVLQPRRTPQAAVAWILFIVALPYLAVPVFLVLGFRKRARKDRQPRFLDLPAPSDPLADVPEAPPGAVPPPDLPSTAALFRNLGASPPLAGNRIALQAAPEAARAALEAVIASAQIRLDVMVYLIADDAAGHAMLNLLAEKARAGVKVRLALDRLATIFYRPRDGLRAFVAAGGELRFASPFLGVRGGVNLRNHRKMVLADGCRLWAGGRNFGDEYLAGDGRRWQDLSFTAEGPITTAWAELFASDWRLNGGVPAPEEGFPPPAGPHLAQLVPSGPDESRDVLQDGLVSAIHRAQERVWIATPYFVPTEALSLALSTAARAGRDVRILVPEKSNQWTADLARGAYLREVERAGVKILRYQPGMMHAKVGVIDLWGWVGSANFDVRSMLLNFESVLAVYDAETAAGLERWFAEVFPLCAEGLRPASVPRRLAEGIFRLGAPIL